MLIFVSFPYKHYKLGGEWKRIVGALRFAVGDTIKLGWDNDRKNESLIICIYLFIYFFVEICTYFFMVNFLDFWWMLLMKCLLFKLEGWLLWNLLCVVLVIFFQFKSNHSVFCFIDGWSPYKKNVILVFIINKKNHIMRKNYQKYFSKG
jgi:hypothetical protein